MATLQELEQELARRQAGTAGNTDELTLEQLEAELERRQGSDAGGSTLANVARQAIGQGAALGFGDEIEAGVKSVLPGYDYESELKRIRRANRAYEARNPYRALALQMGGGAATALIPGLGAANLARGGSLAARAARAVLPDATKMATGGLGALAKEGAKMGATFGAAAGFGTGEGGLENRATGALMGGGTGALGGAVLTPAIGGAARSISAGANALRRSLAGDKTGMADSLLAKRLLESGFDPDEWAPRILSGDQGADTKRAVFRAFAKGETQESLVERGVVGKTAASRMYGELREKLGRDRTLIDVVRDNQAGSERTLVGLARGANAVPSDGQATAATRMAERTMNAQQGYVDDIERATGGTGGAVRAIRDKLDDLREAYGPQYRALREENTLDLAKNANSRAAQIFTEMRESANGKARAAFRDIEETARASLNDFGAPDGRYTFDLINEMQKLARIRAEKSFTGDDAAAGQMFKSIRERILDATGEHFPGFADLRRNYALSMADIKAQDAGASLGAKMGRRAAELEDDIVRRVMPEKRDAGDVPINSRTGQPFKPESDTYKEWQRQSTQAPNVAAGFGDALVDDITSVPAHINPANKLNRTKLFERIRRLLPRREADKLISDIKQRAAMNNTQREIFGGSPTARIQQEVGDIAAESDLAARFLTLDAPGLMRSYGNFIARGITERNAGRLAETLSRMGDREVAQLIDSLSRYSPRIKAMKLTTGMAPAALAVGIINGLAHVTS